MDTKPIGTHKATPEDFVVQELVCDPPVAVPFNNETRIDGWQRDSAFTIFEMSKRGWETETAVEEVAKKLEISVDDISYHGLKDKHARTSQLICVHSQFRPEFSHRDISLVQLPEQDFGWVKFDRRGSLRRGGNWGNRFNIFIETTAAALDLALIKELPNMFGQQRLGQPGSENVGRLLLEGQPEQAIEVLLTTPGAAGYRQAEKLAGGSWEDALLHPKFQRKLGFEIVKWQSFLWNKLLQEKVQFGSKLPDLLPMWNMHPEVRQMYRHIWDPPYPHDRALEKIAISVRKTLVRPGNFQANHEAQGWRFSFDLQSGSYATVVLSQLFQLEEPRNHSTKKVETILPQVSAEDQERVDFVARLRKMFSHRL